MARTRTGRPFPLGATWDGRGVNFALFSSCADKVEVCLFDRRTQAPTRTIELAHRLGNAWYGYVPGVIPGDLYGFRVHGPYSPSEGLRCNPHKLLLDPYAREIVGVPAWGPELYGYELGAEDEDFSFSTLDSAPCMPKGRIVDERFDWGDDRPPAVPWERTVFYEVHVKGFTAAHPGVREDLRGTYAGLASEAAIAHFKQLGVTSIELLPVHAFVDDHRLEALGLRNYWGYNTLGFFAPEARYAATDNLLAEFKGMVKLLHAAGLEVILDVVYNHTAEGNHLGPTLSFKGIDHRSYYRLSATDRRFCHDVTGTGNTVNTEHPMAVRMIIESLRYWVEQMHVDGFRFDLATALGRGTGGRFDHGSKFFSAIRRDPVLGRVKLIAEPWDIGDNGYQVGGFPKGWSEWNGGCRDEVREFWNGPSPQAGSLARALAGSHDTFAHSGRGPGAGINLVTVHDGFTLHDLVSYNGKHNEANHEDNRDGESHNRSWNCGVEGVTQDEVVLALRERQKRNLLTTLFLSQGVPLLLGGDEISRSQSGNNNGYCQDSDISWFHWSLDARQQRMFDFTRRLIALRAGQPALQRQRWFDGVADDSGLKDIAWLDAGANELGPEQWAEPGLTALSMLLAGSRIGVQVEGEPAPAGDSLLLLINRHHEAVWFRMPPALPDGWLAVIDTSTPDGQPPHPDGQAAEGDVPLANGGYLVGSRSVAVLRRPSPA